MILVDSRKVPEQLPDLLQAVEQGEWIRICRDGRPVADLRPVPVVEDPLRQHPELMGVQFREDPMLPLSDEDWPEAA